MKTKRTIASILAAVMAFSALLHWEMLTETA